MKKRLNLFLLLSVFLVSFFINISGIGWGLPGKNTIELVAGEKNLIERLLPVMVETRSEIRTMVKIPGDKYTDFYDENRIISIYHNNKTIKLTVGQINAIRTYLLRTYYPDEHITIVALTNINPEKKQLSPKVLIPGSFYVYTSGLWLGILNYFGVIKITQNVDFYILNPEEMRKIYLWMRVLILLSFFFSVYLIWFTGKLLWNERIGLISSFLFGICPVLNLWNHFGYYYPFAIPFVILSFLFSAKNFKENNNKNWSLAGIFAGISASIVFLYGVSIMFLFVCFFILFFCIEKEKKFDKILLKQFSIGLLSFFLTFILINLFLLIDIKTLLKLMKFEQGDFVFSPHPLLFIFGSLKSACGWPFLVSSITGFIFSIKQKEDKSKFFLAISMFIPLIFLFCFSPWYARRAIFLIPFMAIFSSIFFEWLKNKNRVIGNIVMFFVILFTFFYSAAYTQIFVKENVREEAGRWINANIPENSKIGLMQMPAPYRTPPFQFYRYKLLSIKNKNHLEVLKPDYFIISEYETQGMNTFELENFFENYDRIKEFIKIPSFAGITFKRTQFSAKDFWIPNPCITIYMRKNVEK